MEQKHIFALVALIVIIAIALYTTFKKKEKQAAAQPPYSFFSGLLPLSNEGHAPFHASGYGDSISVPSRLGDVLANKLGVGFWYDNLAIAGTRLFQWLSPGGVAGPSFSLLTMKDQLTQDKSAVIFHRYGMNDALFQTDFAYFKLGLIQFVQTCRELNKIPVLVALTQFSSTNPDWIYRRRVINNIIYEVACTQVTHYIDVELVAFDPAIDTPDQLHPSDAYYARLDDFIATQAIAKNIFQPA